MLSDVTTTQYYRIPTLYDNGTEAHDIILGVNPSTGLITHRSVWSDLSAEQQAQVAPTLTTLPANVAMIPGLVNTHIHTFQSLLKGVADDCDFFTWRDKALYHYARKLTPEDIYVGALFAFSEMILTGITTVCDFFYIHDKQNENAQAVIRAGRDLGLRVVMARTMYDWDGAPERFIETPDLAVANTKALYQSYANDPYVSVLPAPHSLHGASLPMIQAGEILSRELDTPFHMHVAEGEYERQMMIEKSGLSPVAYLAQEGILTHRLVMIHAVWVDDADIALMGQAQCGLAYNPSSNMFLGDGITPLVALDKAGVCISLGSDGGCSNNRASIIEEMRMASLLQKVTHRNSTVTTARQVFDYGTTNGAKNLALPVGQLGVGAPADWVLVDRDDLSMQPDSNWVSNLVYASQPSAIKQVVVGGRTVMQDGELVFAPNLSLQLVVEKIKACWQRLQ